MTLLHFTMICFHLFFNVAWNQIPSKVRWPSLLIPAAALLVSLYETLCSTMLLHKPCSRISDSDNALHDGDLHRLWETMSCDNSSMTAAASSFFQIAATAFPGKNTTGQKWNEYRPLFPVLTVSSWLRGLIWFAPSNYELWVFFTLTLGDSYFPKLAYSYFPITADQESR